MKKCLIPFLLVLVVSFTGYTQITTGGRTIKPVAATPNVQLALPTLQDTLKMLMTRVNELEEQRLTGGRKTIKTITPNTNNMCFPFKNSKYPSQTFYQGVVVDDAVCNNNPNAVLLVTVKTKQPQTTFPVSVSYDAADGKWKISLKGFLVSDLAKNVRCYNFEGKDPTMCPQSGLYHDVGIMSPVTLTPGYDNGIEFNVFISERADYKIPLIRKQ
jgi:hypothetical protein